MRQDVQAWLKQAERDVVTAEHSLTSKDLYAAAFWCQQAVEKGLKAALLDEGKELIKTHSISRLGKMLSVPNGLLHEIATLEPVYQETRYPDITAAIHAPGFEEKDVTEFLNTAMEVIEWVRRKVH